jgi:hypothetical protein
MSIAAAGQAHRCFMVRGRAYSIRIPDADADPPHILTCLLFFSYSVPSPGVLSRMGTVRGVIGLAIRRALL